MAFFKRKIPRQVLVEILAKQAIEEAQQGLQVFSRIIGGDTTDSPLTTESRFSLEFVGLNLSIRGGGFVPGVVPNAPDHLQNGVVELGITMAKVGGTADSYVRYLVPWREYSLGSATDPLVASVTSIFIDRTNDVVKIHEPGEKFRPFVQDIVGKLVEISLRSWNKTYTDFKIVE